MIQKPSPPKVNPEILRRNARQFWFFYLVAAVACLGIMVIASSVLREFNSQPGLRWGIVLIGTVASGASILVVLLPPLRSPDESVRQAFREAMSLAFIVSITLAAGYAFLRKAGIPNLDWANVWPIMSLILAGCLGVVWKKYL